MVLLLYNDKERNRGQEGREGTTPPAFKTKIALDALKREETIVELAQRYQVHPNLITEWKKQLLEHAADVFSKDRGLNTVPISRNSTPRSAGLPWVTIFCQERSGA